MKSILTLVLATTCLLFSGCAGYQLGGQKPHNLREIQTLATRVSTTVQAESARFQQLRRSEAAVVVIGIAVGLFMFVNSFPWWGLAIGIVVGGLAQFAMQLPGLKRRGMLFGLRFNPGHPGVKRIGLLMVPSLLGLSVTQINITVSTILASYFAGGPTYLFYGMRLIQFPLGIFGVALATAILPTLSAQAARGALDELRTTIGFGLRMIFFIILPAMAGLILLRYPIVHLVFEHGTFTKADTLATATALLCSPMVRITTRNSGLSQRSSGPNAAAVHRARAAPTRRRARLIP